MLPQGHRLFHLRHRHRGGNAGDHQTAEGQTRGEGEEGQGASVGSRPEGGCRRVGKNRERRLREQGRMMNYMQQQISVNAQCQQNQKCKEQVISLISPFFSSIYHPPLFSSFLALPPIYFDSANSIQSFRLPIRTGPKGAPCLPPTAPEYNRLISRPRVYRPGQSSSIIYLASNWMSEGKTDRNSHGYIVYPGNNSSLIETALKKRNIWHPLAPEKDLLSAALVWKQLNLASNLYSDFEEVLKCYPQRHLLLNHFEYNHVITTKSGILKTLKYYYSHELALSGRPPHVFEVIPTSFILKAHKNDTEYKDFLEKFQQIEKKNFYKEKVPQKHCQKNVWFVKPESDNQGKGIILSSNIKEIESFLISKPVNSGWIAQKAIERPLLYQGRKFDVRVWVLVSPHLEVYFYNEPYIRTSSNPYTLDCMNTDIHLTNNTMQKQLSQYSKYEEGNTLPFKESFLAHFQSHHLDAETLLDQSLSRMKEIIIDTLMSARKFFGRSGKKKQFQLFGYDFILDEDFRVWLLEVNNNPYLGSPNAFIKGLLPQMVDEMMEIIIDPLFPPVNYSPVQQRRFQMIHKEASLFRLQPIRIASNQTKHLPKRETSLSKYKILDRTNKADLYNVAKEEKQLKPVYSTPSETLKYLLDTYCFNDLEPFMVPVTLILSSNSLQDQNCLESNLRKLKLITETRIARILLEPRVLELSCNIICQEKFGQKVKSTLIHGFVNACKTFKAKVAVIKNLMPLVCEMVRGNRQQLEDHLLESIVKVAIACGAYFDRSIFIPGESRQNQLLRQLFIKSHSMKLLFFLKKTYPAICSQEIALFSQNLSEKDWELFYEVSGNKKKRCYSPKLNTAPENQDSCLMINSSVVGDEKPRKLSMGMTQEVKKFRMRRHSGISPK